jgi:hypothetical protein
VLGVALAAVVAALLCVLIATRRSIVQPGGGTAGSNVFYLPAGDSLAGRAVLQKLDFRQRDRVAGEDFDPPVVDPPVPVLLGPRQARQPRWKLAESIIAPSHRVQASLPDVSTPQSESRPPDIPRLTLGAWRCWRARVIFA